MQKPAGSETSETEQLNGRVDRVSASGVVDSGLIPTRVKPMTLKLVFPLGGMCTLCGMCRCMCSTFVFCTVDQRNLVYMHTSPNVYASWVVPPSGATRATVSTGWLNYFSNPNALQGMPF